MRATTGPGGVCSLGASRAHTLSWFILLNSLLAGCVGFMSGTDKTLVQKDLLVAEQDRRQAVEKQVKDLQQQVQTVAQKQASLSKASEEELARLKLLLLEKDAQIKGLTRKLDEAILEVVRTMAKLRSLQSKAEAASNLAEAEIALKLLKSEGEGKGKDLDVSQAEQMLKLSSQEFKKENYGGAVYLTTKAKDLIKGEQVRSINRENMTREDGEVLFALPLPLKVVKKSNVREGPGLDYKVLFTLGEDTTLLGQSHKGLWVHVESEDGRMGWISYDRIGGQ
jgi:hypothetical protein